MRLTPHNPSRPWRDLKYALWLPLYLLLFLALERMPTGRYWATQLPVDARIPFCEWFIIPYCLWYPFLVLTVPAAPGPGRLPAVYAVSGDHLLCQ